MTSIALGSVAKPGTHAQGDRIGSGLRQIRICHHLPHRLRLGFQPPLDVEGRLKIHGALEQRWPSLAWRDINMGQGIVIRSEGDQLCANQLLETIQAALAQPRVHRVAPPPSRWHQAKDQLRKGSIKLFFGLAVAGWVLPVLPGTPFFLVAWWLGWRPPSKPPSSEATVLGPLEQELKNPATR